MIRDGVRYQRLLCMSFDSLSRTNRHSGHRRQSVRSQTLPASPQRTGSRAPREPRRYGTSTHTLKNLNKALFLSVTVCQSPSRDSPPQHGLYLRIHPTIRLRLPHHFRLAVHNLDGHDAEVICGVSQIKSQRLVFRLRLPVRHNTSTFIFLSTSHALGLTTKFHHQGLNHLLLHNALHGHTLLTQ